MRKMTFMIFAALLSSMDSQAYEAARPKEPVILSKLYSDHKFNVRLATGFQGDFFIESGLSYNYRQASGLGMYGYDLYTAMVLFPVPGRGEQPVWGVKAGAQLFGNLLLFGLETAYFSSKGQSDVMIIPKVGIGVPSLYLSYGYGISTADYPFAQVGAHQLALQWNIPLSRKY